MFEVIEEVVDADNFVRLRNITGLTPRPREAAEKALPNSLYGVYIKQGDNVVAMGRVVGDGVLNFDIVDIAVQPDYQGQGLGRMIMQHIMDYLGREAAKGAYICLMADVPALYEKFGFKLVRPRSEGMYIVK